MWDQFNQTSLTKTNKQKCKYMMLNEHTGAVGRRYKLENWLKHKQCEGGRVLFWKELTSCLDKRTLTEDVLISNVKTTPREFACNYELS